MKEAPHRGILGRLITFEGIEGSGKTTQIEALSRMLVKLGVPVVSTREPGGTPLGEAVRRLVLDTTFSEMSARAELLLYLASRAEHVDHVILPALESGTVVLCDRFSEATLAYQAYGRGLDLDQVASLVSFAARDLRPDLVVLLDLPIEEGLRRIGGRLSMNRVDRETAAFHQRVRDGYRSLATRDPERIVVFDACQSPDDIHRAIADRVVPLCQATSTRSIP